METDKTDFPLYLFSNGSMDIFKSNEPGHFKNRLAQPITLTGKWEVGLSMLQYPNNWKNITRDCEFKMLFYIKDLLAQIRKTEIILDMKFESGYYTSVELVRQKLNLMIQSSITKYITDNKKELSPSYQYKFEYDGAPSPPAMKLPEFIFLEKEQRMVLKSNDIDEIRIGISIDGGRDIWRALGYGNNSTISASWSTGDYNAQYQPSLLMNFHSLFVYSPIIEAINVGDVCAPLLALVPVKGDYNHYTFDRIDKPIYTPLSQNYISEIEIKITDTLGNIIPFLGGSIGLLLHFKRRS